MRNHIVKSDDDLLKRMYAELHLMGYEVSSSYYFVNHENPSTEAAQCILKYIPLIDDVNAREGLIRSVGIKGFIEALPVLFSEYEKSENATLRWVIGNSIYIIRGKNIADRLISLLEIEGDPGEKQTLLWALGATKDPRAIPILLKYLDVDGLAGHALEGLKYFNDKKLIPYVEPFTTHKMKWIANKAKSILRMLNK